MRVWQKIYSVFVEFVHHTLCSVTSDLPERESLLIQTRTGMVLLGAGSLRPVPSLYVDKSLQLTNKT